MTTKPFWRLLRTYHVQCASRDYECRHCKGMIHENDEYFGFVYVSVEHKIAVEREHEFCEPDPDPWDDEERDKWENLYQEKDSNSVVANILPAIDPRRKAA